MKIIVGTTDGKTIQEELEDASQVVGKSMGEEIDGGIIGLKGYSLEVTGGSDKSGFPMRATIDGSERKKVLIEQGQGINEEENGVRRRKTVRGNMVSTNIEQLNTKVVEEGSKPVEELLGEDEE